MPHFVTTIELKKQPSPIGTAAIGFDCGQMMFRPTRRWLVVAAVGTALTLASVCSAAQSNPPAGIDQKVVTSPQSSHLNDLGAEGAMLAKQTGTWDVTETAWGSAGAKPVVISHLIAERRLVGGLLEETLRATSSPTILRRDFLTFDRVEGRWEYMSFDTRAQVGMMTAQSYGPENNGTIDFVFQPFALPGGSPVPGDTSVTGQMVRLRQVIVLQSDDHIIKNQYFTLANGVGGEWLAHRYDSTRRN